MDIVVFLAYILMLLLALVSGDRLGHYIGCVVRARCTRRPPLHLPLWLDVSIALLVPLIALLGLAVASFSGHRRVDLESLAYNVEVLMAGAFFVTGLIGGFMNRLKKA